MRVDLSQPAWLEKLWNSTVFQVLRHFHHGHLLSFDRTYLASLIANYKIRRATRLNKDIDYSFFTTFGYYNKYSSKPSIQLCDWTLEYYITQRLSRQAYYGEKMYIKRESNALRKSFLSVSLFRDCKAVIEEQIPGVSIVSFESNVVNVIDPQPLNPEAILEQKNSSNLILFIGDGRYAEGAKTLLQSYQTISQTYKNAEVAFVGLSYSDIGVSPDNPMKGVTCYGYLNKSIPTENKLYYDLLRKAKVIVNTNEKWAGFSSIVEAMYYYTPVIVTPFSSFVDTFGSKVRFGYYVSNNCDEAVAKSLSSVLSTIRYQDMCMSAHDCTRSFTWSHFVLEIESCLI